MTTAQTFFCVAAKSFNKYSETFIRNHAKSILPGKTALVCLDSSGDSLSVPPSEGFFNFLPDKTEKTLLPRKVQRFFKFLVGGSVFYRGINNERRLVEFFKKNGIKVVLAEYGPTGCVMASACRRAGVALYVHFHGYDASILVRRWHVRYSYRRLFRDTAGFIFPSDYLANKLCSSIGVERNERIHVVPCSVKPDEFQMRLDRDKNLLLAVGRFTQKKAPDKTILAFSKILQFFPDLRLEMIGDGELLASCRTLVKNLGMEGNIIFHGGMSHDFVRAKMTSAQLFLQHSVTAENGDVEGLPVVVLEAMASGAVVVSTKHSGIPEAVVNGVTGLLVSEQDVDGMAQCCIQLLTNEDLLLSMREEAHKRIEERFTVEQQVARLREIMGLQNEWNKW